MDGEEGGETSERRFGIDQPEEEKVGGCEEKIGGRRRREGGGRKTEEGGRRREWEDGEGV